jgi:long-chain fatty acid transport protein
MAKIRLLHIPAVCTAVILSVVPGTGFAASFYLQEQSVSSMGSAFAGATADTPDASTIYFNPAGMTDLDGAQISVGGNALSPDSDYSDKGSTVSSLPGTGGATVAMEGDDGSNPFGLEAVPNVYIAAPITENIWAGVGVSAPFGLENEYEDDYTGRYDSTESMLTVIDVAPSVAWAPRPWISFGAGMDIQHAQAKLENAVPSPITAGGPTPATDGLTDLSGDDMTVGFNAGVIIKPYPLTRVGLHYRQGISHTLEGRVITRIPDDIPGVGGTFTRTGGSAELDLPDIVSVGVSHKIGKVTLLGSVNWYEWSNFDDIPVQLDDGTFTQSIQNYKDTWSFAAGARYQVNDQLQLKAGVQYDPTPTQDGFRSTRTPDGDRTWIAAGAEYAVSDKMIVDISAAYLDVSEESINLSNTVPIGGGASTTYNINATTEGYVGIAGVAMRYKLGAPKKD